jgi:dipeptidyl aminopeptidase/acylaminoacyl peptidase
LNRYFSFRRAVGVATVGVATIGAGGAIAPSSSTALPRLGGEVAVVVESGGKQAVAVLSASAKGWRVVSRIPVKRGIRSIAWSPTWRKLAVTTAGGNLSNELRVIDLARGAQRTLATAKRADPAAFFGSLAWSPEGRRIAVTRSMGFYGADINILDASRGSLVRSFRASARYDSALAWSSDGASLYFAEQKTARTRPKL